MKTALKSLFLLALLPMAFYFSAFFFTQEDTLEEYDLELSQKLNKKMSGLPPILLSHPKLELQWRASYARDPFFGSEESVFILQSSDFSPSISRKDLSWKNLESYYMRSIGALGWQVIQHLHNYDSCLLIAESPFQVLLTFVISFAKPVSVKIYTRPTALY